MEKHQFSVLCVGILFQLHRLRSGVHPGQVAVHHSSEIISHEDGESEPPQKEIHCFKHFSRDDLWDTMKPQQYAKSTLWVETAQSGDILLFFQFTTGLKRTLALQAYSECYFIKMV